MYILCMGTGVAHTQENSGIYPTSGGVSTRVFLGVRFWVWVSGVHATPVPDTREIQLFMYDCMHGKQWQNCYERDI